MAARRQPKLFDGSELGRRDPAAPKRTPHYVTRCDMNPYTGCLDIDLTLCWKTPKPITISVPPSMVPTSLEVEATSEELPVGVDTVTYGKCVGPEIHQDGLYMVGLVRGEYVSFKLDASAMETIVAYKERMG